MDIRDELQIVDSHRKVDAILRQLADLRAAVGADMDLAFDFHGRVHLPMAKVLLREIEPLRPFFVEDAVQFFHVEALAELSRAAPFPLVIGERLHSRFEFKHIFERGAASVINPEVCCVGGISEMVRIATWAEGYDIALAPHCPVGPIALAASLQIDAICHNAFIQEQSLGIHSNAAGDLFDYVRPEGSFRFEDGLLAIPDGPGLGIEVDEDKVRTMAQRGHDWRAPTWRHADGSVSDW